MKPTATEWELDAPMTTQAVDPDDWGEDVVTLDANLRDVQDAMTNPY